MLNVCDDNITNLSFRCMQKCLHLFMQSFRDSVFLTLYYYDVKSKKVNPSGQQRKKVLVSKKHAASHFLTHSIPALH